MWHMDNVGWAWWVLMSIGMVAVWGLLIYAIYMVLRGPAPERTGNSPEPPEVTLQRRLAAGEISLDEYEQLREAVEADPRRPVGVG